MEDSNSTEQQQQSATGGFIGEQHQAPKVGAKNLR